MTFPNPFVFLLIVIAAVIYGVLSGRAKAARLRELERGVRAGDTASLVIIGFVILVPIVMILNR